VTETKHLRAGVVGTGVFGRFHAQKYANHPDVLLAGLYDADSARAAEAAAALGTRAFASMEDLLQATDIVSVTTPASTHGAVAMKCLLAGKHVYVEKPIATTLADADLMIAEAAKRTLVLQTGHQERLVLGLTGLQEWGIAPLSIDCVRAGPFAGRALDVSVVFDLMIHDIDLALWIAGSHLVSAQTTERAGPGGPSDEVETSTALANGCKVSFLASRNAPERRRGFRAVYADGEVSIDFLTRAVTNTTPRPLRPLVEPGGDAHPDLADSVGGGVRRFVAAVAGKGPAMVSPAEARSALDAALRILSAAQKR
jgi:predicted dehydrogenase